MRPALHSRESVRLCCSLCRYFIDLDDGDEAAEVEDLLESMGGWPAQDENDATLVITQHMRGCAQSDSLSRKMSGASGVFRTPVWVRDCMRLRAKEFPSNGSNAMRGLLHRPLPKEAIEGSGDMQVTLTGFQNVERDTIKALIQLTGAQQTNNMTKNNTHVICLSHKQGGDKPGKYESAKKWGLTCVNHVWLFDSITMWKWMDGADYQESGEDEIAIER